MSEEEKTCWRYRLRRDPDKGEGFIRVREERRRLTWRYHRDPSELAKDLREIVSRLRTAVKIKDVNGLLGPAGELSDMLHDLMNFYRILIPLPYANELSADLIEIFGEAASFTKAYSYLPLSYSAKYATSPQAKAYVLQWLNSPDAKKREEALIELAWSYRLRGDAEIYSALEALYNKAHDPLRILAVMARLDRRRTIPAILKEIDKADSPNKLSGCADLISEYGRTDLLEPLLKRMRDFPQQGLNSADNPTIGLEPSLLLKYLEEREGEKLEWGLYAMEQDVISLGKVYPLLMGKLKSKDPRSRRAVIRSLGKLAAEENLNGPHVIEDLEKHLPGESDDAVREEALAAIKAVKEKLKPRGRSVPLDPL